MLLSHRHRNQDAPFAGTQKKEKTMSLIKFFDRIAPMFVLVLGLMPVVAAFVA